MRGLPFRPSAVALLVLLAPKLALAQEAELEGEKHVYSRYERETIDAALSRMKLRPEASPEGKLIESVEVEPLDVVEQRDPIPDVLALPRILTPSTSPAARRDPRRRCCSGPARATARPSSTRRAGTSAGSSSSRWCSASPSREHARIGCASSSSPRTCGASASAGTRPSRTASSSTCSSSPPSRTSPARTSRSPRRSSSTPATYSLGAQYAIPRLAGSWIQAQPRPRTSSSTARPARPRARSGASPTASRSTRRRRSGPGTAPSSGARTSPAASPEGRSRSSTRG